MGGVEAEVGRLLFQEAEKAEHHEHMWQVWNTDLAPRIVKLANHLASIKWRENVKQKKKICRDTLRNENEMGKLVGSTTCQENMS